MIAFVATFHSHYNKAEHIQTPQFYNYYYAIYWLKSILPAAPENSKYSGANSAL